MISTCPGKAVSWPSGALVPSTIQDKHSNGSYRLFSSDTGLPLQYSLNSVIHLSDEMPLFEGIVRCRILLDLVAYSTMNASLAKAATIET